MYSNAGLLGIHQENHLYFASSTVLVEDRSTVRYAGIFVFCLSGFVFKNPTAHKPEKGYEVKEIGDYSQGGFRAEEYSST